ncbi:MAG: LysR family transcriptional regulator, partial [Bradymonadia bacterium]
MRQFVAVARLKTLSKAADSLSTSPATLHRRMNQLESALGQTLFIRRPKGYALTVDGEVLYQEAIKVEDSVFRVHRSMVQRSAAFVGEVRVTLPEDLVPMVAPTVEMLGREHPGLTVVFLITAEMMDVGREADIALRFGDKVSATHIVKSIARVNWCLYQSRRNGVNGPDAGYVSYTDTVLPRMECMQSADVSPIQVNRVTAALSVLKSTGLIGPLPCHVGDLDEGLLRVGEVRPEWQTHLRLVIHEDLRRAARVRLVADRISDALV